MVKITGPLMSSSASGQIAKQLIFSQRKSGQQVRQFHAPNKEASIDQTIQRVIMGTLTGYWQNTTEDERQSWNQQAQIYNDRNINKLSGFNLFVQIAQTDLLTYTGLCGYWPLDKVVGNQTLDYSGQNKTGTVYGPYNLEPGKIKNSIGYPTTVGRINVGYLSGNTEIIEEITTLAWLKPKGTYAEQRYIAKYTGGGAINGHICNTFVGTTKHIQFRIYSGGVLYRINSLVNSAPVDMWTHVACVYNKGLVQIYINGELNKSQSIAPTSLEVYNYPFTLLSDNFATSTNFFQGQLDDVRIYNRPLGASEIKMQSELLVMNKKRQQKTW